MPILLLLQMQLLVRLENDTVQHTHAYIYTIDDNDHHTCIHICTHTHRNGRTQTLRNTDRTNHTIEKAEKMNK